MVKPSEAAAEAIAEASEGQAAIKRRHGGDHDSKNRYLESVYENTNSTKGRPNSRNHPF
jgi:hypothetical protein